MATVTSSKRQLTHTSNTYESNGDVTIGGNLNINGTTTTIDTANLLVEDKNIIIGDVSSPSDTTADGGGITLKGASDKTINWVNSTDSWTSNQRFSAPNLTLTGLSNQSSEATALVVNGSNVVGTRELGSAAFSATSAFATASHSHAASDITSGTLATARIPSLAASKITSGTLADARIPSLAASKITSGTLDNARLDNTIFRHRGTLDLTSSSGGNNSLPFDDAHTETRVAEYGTRALSYTGASATMLTINTGGSASVFQIGAHYNGNDFYMRTRTDSSNWKTWKKLWHAGNDGSGSGLDADTLDGSHASAFAAAIDGATSIWNADGDGDVFTYNDSNPTHNSKGTGAVIYIRGDGTNDHSLVRAGIFTSDHVSTANGYYVGTLLGTGNSTTTQVINGSGEWTGSVIPAAKLSTATTQSSSDNSTKIATTEYVQGQNYLTSSSTQSKYLRSDANDTATGLLTLNGGVHILSGTGGGKLRIKRNSGSTDGDDIMDIHMDDSGIFFDIDNDNDNDTANVNFRYKTGGSFTNTLVWTTSGISYKGNTIWHAGNDGSGSGLDADTLDGLQLNSDDRNDSANVVCRTQANGYAYFGWLNTTSGNNGTTAISRIYASHDGFVRYYTPANFGAQIGSHISYNDLTNKPTIPSLSGYATEAHVSSEISNLIGGAPAALDTLNELAAAIGDDASYASSITTALAGKLSTTGKAANSNLLDGIDSSGFVKTSSAQTISGVKTYSSRGDFSNADGLRTNQVRTYGGQQLVLNAGESSSYFTGQTNEFVYLNAESGVEINSSPDNWSSGWAGRKTTTINNTSGDSHFSRNITLGGTVDGRDVASDGSKLDGIASGATANTGTLTSVGLSVGTGLDGGGTVSGSSGSFNTITLDLSELTDMTGAINTSQDELILLDNGAERRKLFSEIFGSNAYNSTTIPTNNNQLTNGASYITGASPALTGAVTVTGSGSSGNAFAVMRGSDSAQVLRIQNTGEVVVQNNYLYAASSGTSLYVQNSAVFRGSISNDGSNEPVTIGDDLYVSSDLTIGSGSSQSNLHIKKADNDVSDHIVFYNGTTRVGEIGVEDNDYLRINQETAKNIYTPRFIRADGGFLVDGTSKGIDGSGNFFGGTITGASDANVSNWNTAYGWGNHASAGYVTSSGNTVIGTDSDINTSGATVVDQLNMTDGVIQSHSTRTLTLADLGYTGATNANNYSLPAGSSSTRGGFKIGFSETGKYYPVETSAEKMFVHVPWVDTNTNTTYSAGRGLDESSGEFQLETDLRDSISYIGYDSGDYIQWSVNSYFRSVVNGSERFRVNSSGIDVNGTVIGSGFQTDTTNTNYNLITRNSTSTTLYVQAAQSNSTQTIASFRYGSATPNQGTETFRIRKDNVNVFGANFTVGGSITGNSKNFSIPHPTKEGKRLVHSCLEGPEIGVYFRGRSTSATIEMPDYWDGLVHLDSMTVELTPIGPNQDLYVADIADDGDVTVASNTETPLNYFYVVYGERKDIDKLEVEIDDTVEVEESSDNSEEP